MDSPTLIPEQPLRVLDITTLFPSESQPHLGLFVERRIKALAELCKVQVVVGIGRFPVVEYHPRYRERRMTPDQGKTGNAEVSYARFLSVPRYLKTLDAYFFARSIHRFLRGSGGDHAPQVILAELAYPDGFAAYLLSKRLGIPYVVTLRGHDINDLPHRPGLGAHIATVLRNAAFVIPVADALGQAAVEPGADPKRVVTVPNGVDLTVFGETSRESARVLLGIAPDQKLLVSVGHLVERKGHHLVVRALAKLEEDGGVGKPQLTIIGGPSEEGDASKLINAAINETSMEDRVIQLGARPAKDVAIWLAAADALVLASSKEGRPNVVLEAFASGIPAIATRVWGTPELISDSCYGILVDREVDSIAAGIRSCLSRQWDRGLIRRRAELFSWGSTANALESLLRRAVDLYLPLNQAVRGGPPELVKR